MPLTWKCLNELEPDYKDPKTRIKEKIKGAKLTKSEYTVKEILAAIELASTDVYNAAKNGEIHGPYYPLRRFEIHLGVRPKNET